MFALPSGLPRECVRRSAEVSAPAFGDRKAEVSSKGVPLKRPLAVGFVCAYSRRVENRIELARWLCKQHNTVNEKLGKDQFPCDVRSLDRCAQDGADRVVFAGDWHRLMGLYEPAQAMAQRRPGVRRGR